MRRDSARLAELRRAAILDSFAEPAYDEITRLVAATLAVPITLVNLLDAERDGFKSRVGLAPTESPAALSFCEMFFDTTRDLVVVEDTQLDPSTRTHPLVAGQPYIRFFAAARLAVRGETVGTLCAFDTRPRQVPADQLAHLQALASAVVEVIGRRHAVAGEPAGRD